MSPLSVLDVATATGLSPHTIRGYRERGVLDPSGSLDDFTQADLDRIKLVLQLQAEGLGLGFIERLIGGGETAADQLLDLRRRVLDGLAGTSQVTTADALVARFGDFGGTVLEMAFSARLLVLLDDGRIEVPSPRLLDIAERTVAAGISLPTAVRVAGAVREACLSASGTFLRAILDEIWVPFKDAECPPEQVLDIARRMLELRALVQGVFEATLPGVMVQVFDRPFDEDLDMIRAIAATVDS